jgi:lysine 2,3-aminomutase
LTPGLAATLAGRRFSTAVVAHFNHPAELTEPALRGLAALRRSGIPVFNQSVLLAGVNDEEDTLYALFQNLYEHGVTPYYLHHPDWTPGTFHFKIPIARGRQLLRALAGRLSGPALPRYMLDLPGGLGKVDLMGEGNLVELESRAEETLGGARHEAVPPRTRSDSGASKVAYVELWPISGKTSLKN